MPEETKVLPGLAANTPSLGVRLWVEDDKVCVQIASEGGRGPARQVVLLPVRRPTPATLECSLDLNRFGGDEAPARALRCLHFRPASTLSTPFIRRYYGDQWQRLSGGGQWVLVLMLYDQPGFPAVAGSEPVTADYLAAMRDFFDDLPAVSRLVRGLVWLDPLDVPDSVTPPPAASETARCAALPEAPAAGPARAAFGAAQPQAFTFALASCQYPAGLVDGTPQDWVPGGSRLPGPADVSMLRLARRLDDLADPGRPSLLVLAGDQIYADATAGLFDPRAGSTPRTLGTTVREAEDWLRIPYQSWYGSVGPQSVLGRLPSRMMLDDHEIDDNWEPLPGNAAPAATAHNQALRQAGRQAYQRYQRNLPGAKLLDELWHDDYRHRNIRFFMADTRTERGVRNAVMDARVPRIIGKDQAVALSDWLAVDTERPAFVVSPSMLLPRRRSSIDHPHRRCQPSDGLPRLRGALQSDAWCGYPGSLHALLALLWRQGRCNLVFLSGDEHLSSVVKATITRLGDGPCPRSVTLHSVHSSALYAPYPFANAVPEEFAVNDAWDFADPDDPAPVPARYHCQVEPCCAWAPGDGFALLTLLPPPAVAGSGGAAAGNVAPAWQLGVNFDRATPGPGAPPPPSAQLTLGPGPGPVQRPPPG